MNFKKWLKSIQTAGYNGARTVDKKYGPSRELGDQALGWAYELTLQFSVLILPLDGQSGTDLEYNEIKRDIYPLSRLQVI